MVHITPFNKIYYLLNILKPQWNIVNTTHMSDSAESDT
ncbi:hypothetical protein BIFADO_00302 [Bifidobacterium adolescentis L2-32]|uniref:Uncharacterized protein n=1 Tax=Bifidobacterium adolescentis L2-32 TaxID=411481 RepID=A7A3B1_BIFAD|nr:hypothetical protein BIFADO_00302 [Bifidobacterium adolescentis L2-32]